VWRERIAHIGPPAAADELLDLIFAAGAIAILLFELDFVERVEHPADTAEQ